MRTRVLPLLVLLVLSLGAAACERVDQTSFQSGPLEFVTPAFRDAIPASYGELVGVTTHEAHPYQAVLWFQQADQTLVLVRVNISEGKVQGDAMFLPRR